MSKKRTVSLHLAKENLTDFDDVLTDAARELVNSGSLRVVDLDSFGDGARLYAHPGQLTKPKWANELEKIFGLENIMWSRSPCALVVFKISDRVFAITYSFGHVYLDIGMTEADFGLMVAVNFISDSKIRGVERSNLGLAIRDFAQAAGQKELSAFRIDDTLDLIRKVSGYSEKSEFADVVTGARALRFSKEIDFEDVPASATEALDLFQSTAYRKTPFRIIDSLAPVTDPLLENALNNALTAEIKAGSGDFEIAFPEIISDNLCFFRFEGARINDFYADLTLELYCEGLGSSLQKLSFGDLRKHRIAVYDAGGTHPIKVWPLLYSLVGSLLHAGQRFALNEGKWYRINATFKALAETQFSEALLANDKKLGTFTKHIKPGKKGKPKEGYETEESYNIKTSAVSGYICLDRKLVAIPGVPGQRVEVCDLLDIAARRFIHIKKGSNGSSVLSHLFKQGTNAAQIFRSSSVFREEVVKRIKSVSGDKSAGEFESSVNKEWTVEFRIADHKKKSGMHDIPFFSKLSFRDEASRLGSMGFDVGIGFITLPDVKLK